MAPTGLSISVSGIGTGDADSINVASAVDPIDFGIFSAEKETRTKIWRLRLPIQARED